MPQIAEIKAADEEGFAWVKVPLTQDEDSVTLWTEDEKHAAARSAANDALELAAIHFEGAAKKWSREAIAFHLRNMKVKRP